MENNKENRTKWVEVCDCSNITNMVLTGIMVHFIGNIVNMASSLNIANDRGKHRSPTVYSAKIKTSQLFTVLTKYYQSN